MEIDFIIKIVALIAMISFVFLAFALISYFKKATVSLEDGKEQALIQLKALVKSVEQGRVDLTLKLDSITKDVKELKVKSIESLNNNDIAAKGIASLTKDVHSELSGVSVMVREKIENVYDLVSPMAKLIDLTHKKISNPILTIATYFSATSKATKAFSDYFRKK